VVTTHMSHTRRNRVDEWCAIILFHQSILWESRNGCHNMYHKSKCLPDNTERKHLVIYTSEYVNCISEWNMQGCLYKEGERSHSLHAALCQVISNYKVHPLINVDAWLSCRCTTVFKKAATVKMLTHLLQAFKFVPHFQCHLFYQNRGKTSC